LCGDEPDRDFNKENRERENENRDILARRPQKEITTCVPEETLTSINFSSILLSISKRGANRW
jgi:hypothetical protein